MTRKARREAFARAYFTPGPTFQNATASYKLVFPDASDLSAKRSGLRLLQHPEVQKIAAELREDAFTAGALTLPEFITWGWETLKELREMSKGDPKYTTAIPNLYDRVGRAAGFMVQRVEDMTPPERRVGIGSAELIAATKEALARFERLNEPNPMPQLKATIAQDADYEITDADDSDGTEEAEAQKEGSS
jgi:hypothetical protein